MLYAFDAADVMDNNNYANELESFVSTSSLQVAQVDTEKVSGLDHLVLAKKGLFHPSTFNDLSYHITWCLHCIVTTLIQPV